MIADQKCVAVVSDPVTLAVAVVAERIRTLPPEDREDLFELTKVFLLATKNGNFEELESAGRAMQEILEQKLCTVSRVNPIEDASDSVGQWVEWVSNRIRTLRKAKNKTQGWLAKESGLPQSHISRLENGEHSPSFITLQKIAKALDVPVSELDPSAPDATDAA